MRKVLYIVFGGLAGLLVLIVAALLIAPAVVDVKGRIIQAAGDATGREVTIDGPVEVSLLPEIRVHAADVRLSNVEGAPTPQMATVGALTARVAVWPLLTGRVVVEELVVEQPRVALYVDESGRPNWRFQPAEPAEEAPAPEEEPDEAPGLPALTVKGARITDGRISYVNAQTGQTVEAEAIALTAGLPGLDSPFQADLNLQLNGKPVALTASLATPAALMAGERGTLTVKLDSEPVSVSYDGGVQTRPVPGLDGEFDAKVPSVGELAAWLDSPLEGPDPGPLEVHAVFEADGAVATLQQLDIQGEALRATASGRLDMSGEVTAVELKVESDSLNIDRYLPPPEPAPAAAEKPRRPMHEPGERNLFAALPDEPFDLKPLRRIKADVQVAIAGARVRGFEVGEMRLTAQMADGTGTATLEKLALYGGEASGEVKLDAAGEALSVNADLGLDGIDVGALARAAMRQEPPVTGVATGAVVLSGSGRSPRALAQSLAGQVDFDLKEVDAQGAAAAKVSGLSLDVALPSGDARPTLDARVVYNNEPVNVNVTLDPLPQVLSGQRFAAEVNVQSTHLTASYEGAVQRLPAPGLDGTLEVRSPAFGELLAWAGQPLPEGQPAPGALALDARFAAEGQRFTIEQATVTGEGLDAELSGFMERGEDTHRVQMALRTGVLELGRYLPEPPAQPKDAAAPAPSPAATGNPLESLPTEPFNLQPLRRMQAEVDVEIAGVRGLPYEVGRTAFTATVSDGVARLNLSELGVFAGRVTGTAEAGGSGDALAVQAKLQASGLDAEQLPGASGLQATGTIDANIEASGRGANPRALAGALTGNAALSLADGSVAAGPGTLSALQAKLALPAVDQPAEASVDATYNGKPVKAQATIGPLGEVLARAPFTAKASLEAEPVRFAFDGNIRPEQPGLDGSLDLDVPSIAALATWLELPLPEQEQDPGGLKVAATVEGSQDRIALTEAEITGKAVEATASGHLETAGAPMKFGLEVDVAKADLNAYLPPRPEEAEDGEAAPAETGEPAEPAPAGEEGWSEEPIDLMPLHMAEGTAVVRLAQVAYREMTVDKATWRADLKGGVLETALSDTQVSGGTVAANATIDGSGDAAKLSYKVDVAGVQARPVLHALAGSDRLSGTTEFTAEGQASGRSQKALVESLNGQGAFTFLNGAIHGINLAATLRQAKTLGLKQEAAEERKTDFAELSGSFVIENGVLRNDDLKMLAPLVRLSGKGTVALPPRRIDYTAEAKLVGTLKGQGGAENLKGIPIPIRVTGPLSAPGYKVEWANVMRSALENPEQFQQMPQEFRDSLGDLGGKLEGSEGLGKALQGLIGGAAPEGGTEAEPTGEGSPAGEVKKLLEGLTGSQEAPATEGEATQEGGTADETQAPKQEKPLDKLKSLFGD